MTERLCGGKFVYHVASDHVAFLGGRAWWRAYERCDQQLDEPQYAGPATGSMPSPHPLFGRHTSAVDWCEPNYAHSAYIAEFFNTVSNVLFFVYPPLLAILCQPASRQVAVGSRVVWAMIALIGLGSVYFHATLSMAGQLMDELAILWAIMAALATWIPKVLLPAVVCRHITLFRISIMVLCFLGTSVAALHPAVNACVLISVAIPAFYIMIRHLQGTNSERARRLGTRLLVLLVAALICWISDRIACGFWLRIGFPYLHAFWHILISISACQGCVMYAYFDACAEASHKMPTIKFWPDDSWEWIGVPYVDLKVDEINEDV